jgi:hypothetical protein
MLAGSSMIHIIITFRVSRKNKFMLSCVRVQVHFKEECLIKTKN